jgi:hypothetical protein
MKEIIKNLVKLEPANININCGLPSTISYKFGPLFSCMYTPNETRLSQGGTEISRLLVDL